MNPLNECEECGKAFTDSARLFTHQKKSCRPGKRSWKELLSDARDVWKAKESESRKRPRLEPAATTPSLSSRSKRKLRPVEKPAARGTPSVARASMSQVRTPHRNSGQIDA
jgi:hypothetical protein